MSKVYFTTTNGDRSGRASGFYAKAAKAATICISQNTKAEEMEIMTRYQVAECLKSELNHDSQKNVIL